MDAAEGSAGAGTASDCDGAEAEAEAGDDAGDGKKSHPRHKRSNAATDEDTVFDIVESPVQPGRVVALLAMRPVAVVLDIARDGSSVTLVKVVVLPRHPMFATFDASGTLVLGSSGGTVQAVSLTHDTVADPLWLSAMNAALTGVISGTLYCWQYRSSALSRK